MTIFYKPVWFVSAALSRESNACNDSAVDIRTLYSIQKRMKTLLALLATLCCWQEMSYNAFRSETCAPARIASIGPLSLC